jgi:hypothetical protein
LFERAELLEVFPEYREIVEKLSWN